MKRIIKLTERDLTRIVKRVLKENIESKPEWIEIKFTDEWEDRMKSDRDDNLEGHTPLGDTVTLRDNGNYHLVGLGPYRMRNNSRMFYFAQYAPEANEIFVQNMECYGNYIGRAEDASYLSQNELSYLLDLGPKGCQYKGYAYHKFEKEDGGFTVGAIDRRDSFEIVATSNDDMETDEFVDDIGFDIMERRYIRR